MVYLQIQPEFWRSPEISSQSDCCIGGNVTTAAHDLRNSIRRHLERSRQCAFAHSKRFQELFQKNFSGVRTNTCHPPSVLMIIDDLDVTDAILRPSKAEPPLIVDANAKIAGSISL